MNNNTQIILGEKSYPIIFGMTSYFTLINKAKNANGDTNAVKAAINIIYSGIDNWCTVHEKPTPKYAEIYELVEQEFQTMEGQQRVADVLAHYENTAAGKALYGDADKKKAGEKS